MRPISDRVKEILNAEPDVCARRRDGNCGGRITLEHTLIYAGRQIDEAWAIIKICAYHHAVDEYQDGGDLNKEKNVWIALNRASDTELLNYSKAIDYRKLKDRLNDKYNS